jgi:hypothetical protein
MPRTASREREERRTAYKEGEEVKYKPVGGMPFLVPQNPIQEDS